VPGTFIAGAVIMDGVLCLSRSWLITALFGAPLFALSFYPSNWAFLAPYFQPVKVMDSVTAMASQIGYMFPRTGTPEYVRLIERGTLRTFGSPVWVSAVFSSFVSIGLYFLWWYISSRACRAAFVPVGYRFKSLYGMKDAQQATAAPKHDLGGKTPVPGGVA
jgi:methane/ammonia monooxygenase subunit A